MGIYWSADIMPFYFKVHNGDSVEALNYRWIIGVLNANETAQIDLDRHAETD